MEASNKRGRDEEGDNDGEKNSCGKLQTICCVVENRARETVVAVARSWWKIEVFTLVDNPTYGETTDLLAQLSPDEILLHGSSCVGPNKSLLFRKIEAWRTTSSECCPEIRPVSRAYFDQDRGAEFLRRVSKTQVDSEVLARYTVLGAAFALLKYIESASSMTFPRASVSLNFVDSNAGDFMTIDRRTVMGLELLANARSGDQTNCLFGKVSRSLRNSGDK